MKVRFIYSQLAASLSSPTHSNEDQVQQPTPTETKAKAKAQIKCESNSKKTQNGISHLFTEKCCLLMNEAKFRYGKRGVWPCLWYIQIIFVATCKHKKRKLLLFAHLSFIVHLIARSFTKYLLSRIHANGAAPDNLLQNSIFQSHRLHFEAGGAPRLAVYQHFSAALLYQAPGFSCTLGAQSPTGPGFTKRLD